MKETLILDIFNTLKPELFWMVFWFCVGAFIVLLVKGVLEQLVAYCGFCLNRELGKYAKVELKGKKGQIADFNLRWIWVSVPTGNMLVPMRRWEEEDWIILHDNDRRAMDQGGGDGGE